MYVSEKLRSLSLERLVPLTEIVNVAYQLELLATHKLFQVVYPKRCFCVLSLVSRVIETVSIVGRKD